MANECVQWKMTGFVQTPSFTCILGDVRSTWHAFTAPLLPVQTYHSTLHLNAPPPSALAHFLFCFLQNKGLELRSLTLSLSCHYNPELFQPATSNKAGERRYHMSHLAASHILGKKLHLLFGLNHVYKTIPT